MLKEAPFFFGFLDYNYYQQQQFYCRSTRKIKKKRRTTTIKTNWCSLLNRIKSPCNDDVKSNVRNAFVRLRVRL